MYKDFFDKFECIVFDLNGTIIQDEVLWSLIYKEVFASEILSDYPYYGERGLTLKDNIDLILSSNDFNSKASSDVYYKTITSKYFQRLDKSRITPGFLEFVNTMINLNKRMALVSNSDSYITKTTLSNLQLTHYFEFVLTSDDVINPKPAPDIYEYAVMKFGVSKEKVLVFEDSLIGNFSAEKAGLERMIILPENLEPIDYGSNTEHFIENFNEINPYVDVDPEDYIMGIFNQYR
jgi:HAD superfamily hydrolase (TIGR01509 family)